MQLVYCLLIVELKMQKSLRIWLCLDSRATGGIETYVMQLATGLTQAGHKVSVVFIKKYGSHPLLSVFRQKRINVVFLDGRFASLISKINTEKPDIVHSHGYKAGLLCRLAVKLTSFILVSTYHAGEISQGKLAVYDWIDRHTAWINHQSLAVNIDICRRLPSDSKVMDNFIAIPHSTPKTARQIAFVGRLSHEKGPDLLITLATRLPTIEIHIYGSGPMESDLKKQCPANCIFHGNQSNMDGHWKNIDLLIMPSRYEGLPMVAMESMARQIPVIAFDVGAMDKLVIDSKTGWLIPAGRIDRFQDKLEHWVRMNDGLKHLIRVAARKHIEDNFSSTKIIPQILQIYSGLMKKNNPPCDAICKS